MADRRVTFIIGANVQNFTKNLSKAQRKFRNFGRKLQTAGRSLTYGLTVPLGAAGGAAVKLASDFDSSMTRIETLVGLSREQVQGMRDDVLSLSRDTGRGPKELSEALFAVTSAGLRGEEAISTLEKSAKASAIGLGETKDIARALTGVLQSYSEQGLKASEATDTLIEIVRQGNLEASELAPVLGRVTGIASQLGISFGEVGASIASFTRLGVSAEEAVTGLRGIMNALLKQTPKSERALKDVGLTFESLKEKIQKQGLAQALVDLMDAFEGNEKGLAAFAGRVRGLAAIMGTAGAQSESYLDIARQMEDSTGNLDKGFERVSETAEFKFQQALANLKSTAVELGAILLPLANDVLNFTNKWIEAFNSLSAETKRMGLIVAGILGASGPILTALGVMLSALGAISWPIVLGVAALGAATVAIASHWDAVVSYFTKGDGAKLWQTIKESAKEIWGALKGLFKSLADLISEFSTNWGSDVTGAIQLSVKLIAEAVSKIIDSISLVINLLRGDWEAAWRDMKDVATSNLRSLDKETFLAMGSMMQSATAMTNLLTGKFKTAWEQFKFGWGLSNKYSQFIKEQEQKVRDENKKTKEAIQQNGYGAFEPIIDGAIDAALALQNTFDWWARLNKALRSGGGSSFDVGQPGGPGKPSEKTGGNFFVGVSRGVESVSRGLRKVKGNTDAVAAALGNMEEKAEITGQALRSSVSSAITDFGETLGNVFTGDAGAEGFFNNILLIVADFAKQFGRALVAAGVAALAFENLLSNPLAAIIAGTALIATATAVSNILRRGPEENESQAQGMAMGGIVPPGFPNDTYPAMLSSGEKVIPAPQSLSSGGGGKQYVPIQIQVGAYRLADVLAELKEKRSR